MIDEDSVQHMLDRAPDVRQALLDEGTTEEEYDEMIKFLTKISEQMKTP